MKDSLSKPEWTLMETLWNQSPMFLSEIMDAVNVKLNWKRTTYLTYLKKMTEDGLIGFEIIRNSRSYYPLVAREECAINESRSLMARMGDNASKIFLSNMIKEGHFTQEDRDDMKKLIDKLEQEDADQ
jgi:predicted transcriptional regulator